MEFRIGAWQDWSVRPLVGNCEGLREAWRNKLLMGTKNLGAREMRIRFEALRRKLFAVERSVGADGEENMEEPLTDEEREWLKAHDPDMWWVDITETPWNAWMVVKNRKRCPGCGGATTSVGSNFRIPKRKDEKAWANIEEMIERGDDMIAKFSVCATVEMHEEMVDEAKRLRGSRDTLESWEVEKRRRIHEFGLRSGPPTSM
jgi:hypothetical protein